MRAMPELFTHVGTVLMRPKLAGQPWHETVLLRSTEHHWTDGHHRWRKLAQDTDANSQWVSMRLLASSIREATPEEQQQHHEQARADALQVARQYVEHYRRVVRYAEQDVALAEARREVAIQNLQNAEATLRDLEATP